MMFCNLPVCLALIKSGKLTALGVTFFKIALFVALMLLIGARVLALVQATRHAGEAAADALRAPFVLGDTQVLEALFRDAGIAAPHIVSHTGTANFPSIRAMVEADVRGWLPVMGVNLDEPTITRVLAAAEQALAPYATAQGQVEFDSPAHIVRATKPR